ncbi:MAG: hypothetical protein WCK32_00795 [Chlorobiaceae bacterium]
MTRALEILANLIKFSGVVIGQMVTVSNIIGKAQSAGRDLTDQEVALIESFDDAARERLQEAIKGKGQLIIDN